MSIGKEIQSYMEEIVQLKKTFGPGPWMEEPDRQDFKHAGFDCMILRNKMGCWCGYVGLPNGHSQYGKHYDDVPVSAHVGLTYASECKGHICHVVENEEDKVFWLGFDTSHGGDLLPGMIKLRNRSDWPNFPVGIGDFEVYRDVNYAIAETKSLAEQLKDL